MKTDVKKLLDDCGVINNVNVKNIMNNVTYSDYNEYMDIIYELYKNIVYGCHYGVINPIAQKVMDIIDQVTLTEQKCKGYIIIVAFGTLNGLPEKTVEYALKFEELMSGKEETSNYVPIYSSLVAVFYKNKFYTEAIEYLEKLFNLNIFNELPNSIKVSQYMNYLTLENWVTNKEMLSKIKKETKEIFLSDKSDDLQSLKVLQEVINLHQRNEIAIKENNEEELQIVMDDFQKFHSFNINQIKKLVQSQDLYIDILKTFYNHGKYQYVVESCQNLIAMQQADYDDLIAIYQLLINSIEKISGEVGVKIIKSYNEILFRYYETQTFLKQQMIEKSVDMFKLQTEVKTAVRLDPLTGCFNRRYIKTYADAKEEENKLKAVLFCDFDNFKSINDTFGHRIGDTILIDFVESCNIYMKKDTALFRIGGDEFVIISSLDSLEENVEMINLIKKRMNEYCIKKEYTFNFDFSYGIIMHDTTDGNIEKLIDKADELMYIDKSEKKKNSI